MSNNYEIGKAKQIKIPNSEFLIGQIIGAFSGDGCYSKNKTKKGIKHFVRFFLSYKKDKEYKDYLFLLFQNINLTPEFILENIRMNLAHLKLEYVQYVL